MYLSPLIKIYVTQQDLSTRQISIVILPTTSWPKLQTHTNRISEKILQVDPGSYVEISLGDGT